MASSTPLLMRILAASVSTSNRAAGIVRDIMKKGDLGIVKKGKHDIQTEADRAAQRCIVASLHRHFPKICIHAEESLDLGESIPDNLIEKELCDEVLAQSCPSGLQNIKDEEVVIWVDPVDGTTEFTQAVETQNPGLLDHVTVLIGVAVRGRATGGVINQPYYNYRAGSSAQIGRCMWGLVGLGGFGFQRQAPPAGQNIITTTRTHSDHAVIQAVGACHPTEVIRVGGAGHKVLMLMEGKAHAYVYASKGCKKWDTCAPEAILYAVGGHLTDLLGRPIPYHAKVKHTNASGILATVGNHEWYVDQIPKELKYMFRDPEQPMPPSSSL